MTNTEQTGTETTRELGIFTLVADETPGQCERCGDECSIFHAQCDRCWAVRS